MSEKVEKSEKIKLVDVGVVPYDPQDRSNKYLYVSVNGETLMLDRGKPGKLPPAHAEAYYHRVKMAGRRNQERERMEKELRDKQNAEGVQFM